MSTIFYGILLNYFFEQCGIIRMELVYFFPKLLMLVSRERLNTLKGLLFKASS